MFSGDILTCSNLSYFAYDIMMYLHFHNDGNHTFSCVYILMTKKVVSAIGWASVIASCGDKKDDDKDKGEETIWSGMILKIINPNSEISKKLLRSF